MSVPDYTYRVVTSNGHGVHSRDFRRCANAKAHAAGLAAIDGHGFGPYEVERVRHWPGGSRTYWLRKGSRWVLWDAGQDIDARQPDWRWPNA